MYETRNSKKQSSVKNKVTVLSLRSENVPLSKSTQIKKQKNQADLSSINLRKRISVKENDCKNNLKKLSAADKENVSDRILGIHKPGSSINKNKPVSKAKPTVARESIISPKNKKLQVSVSKNHKHLIKSGKTGSYIEQKATTGLKNIYNHMSISNVESGILKPCPVWKLNQYEKKKRSVVDVYDITEDEDLKKEELDVKANLKIIKKQKLSKNDKSGSFKSKEKRVTKFAEKKKESSQLEHKKQPFKDENKLLDERNIKLDEHLNGICVPNKISKHPSLAILEAKNQFLTTISTAKPALGTESPLNQSKMKHTNLKTFGQNCDQISSSKIASSKIVDVPIVDSGKLIFPKITPVKEIHLDSISKENSLASNVKRNINEQDMLFLIPQMTSTPETDIQPCTNAHIVPMNSFVSRISEIPAIPRVYTNIVETDPAIEELLYSSDIASADVALFDSPPKVGCSKENGESQSHLKQLKMNLFLENYAGERNENLNANAASLFESPPKSKKCRTVCDESSVDKDMLKKGIKKPRKSYDNLDHVRINISKWKKTEGDKKMSTAQKKEEELIKSLNEHFSELENFEFCFD